MSKQRRKHNDSNNNSDFNNFDMNNIGSLFNNMNPNQLSSMLNGIDMTQLSSMLQNFNNVPSGDKSGTKNPVVNNRSIDLLNAIKPMVDAEKSQLIESIIQLYNISRIIKK